jgi:hypothetical protein
MIASNRTPPFAGPFATVMLVAAVYAFFLLFAQFGFLQGVRASGHDTAAIHAVLALMALAGITAGFLTSAVATRTGYPITVAIGLMLGAFAALLARVAFGRGAPSFATLSTISLLTGAGIGFATVALAADFRRLTGARHMALQAGAGTALAYFFCSIPAVFQSAPSSNAFISAIVALAGTAAARLLHSLNGPTAGLGSDSGGDLVTARSVALATTAFFALIWFDSAAFAALQNTPEIRTLVWSGPEKLWTIGTVHAIAAITAGVLLDRGRLKIVLLCSIAFLVAGSCMFETSLAPISAPVYGAGVSLYSTPLAVFAALAPDQKGSVRPVWRAAWIFSVSGWAGSVAGVGMAEQFGRLPPWAAPGAAVVLVFALLPRLGSHVGIEQHPFP